MSEMIRLNKFLSEQKYCSRREADRLIEAGKVFVNNKPAKLGDKIIGSEAIRVIGRDIRKEVERVYLMLNKPAGIVTSSNPRKADNVVAFVGFESPVFPVGEMDIRDEGLFMLTNDPAFAKRMTQAKFEFDKEYVVEVAEILDREDVRKMQHGIELPDGKTLPAQVRHIDAKRFAIILSESKKNLVRRMCESFGYHVTSLKRTRCVTLKMPSTYPAGNWRRLTESELYDLKEAIGMNVKRRAVQQEEMRKVDKMKKRLARNYQTKKKNDR